MNRRSVFKNIAVLPFLTSAKAGSSKVGLPATNFATELSVPEHVLSEYESDVYTDLGVKTVINGRGTVTIIGATRMLPEVESAMREATRHFVQIDEMLREHVLVSSQVHNTELLQPELPVR